LDKGFYPATAVH